MFVDFSVLINCLIVFSPFYELLFCSFSYLIEQKKGQPGKKGKFNIKPLVYCGILNILASQVQQINGIKNCRVLLQPIRLFTYQGSGIPSSPGIFTAVGFFNTGF